MATLKIRHLVSKPGAGGSTRYFWQPAKTLRAQGWKPQRLPDNLAEAAVKAEALNAEVDAWRQGQPAPNAPASVARRKQVAPGSVAALITDYKASRWWLNLAPRTRKDYGWCLDLIEAWSGDMPARAITPPAVQAFYEAQLRRVEGAGRKRKVIETPAKAAAAVRVLRLLLQVGVRLGYLSGNPAAKPGISHERAREPVLWSPAAVQHMAATADALGWRSIGTAILLNEWMGQRVADVLRLPPWSLDAGALVILQGKGKRLVSLPVHLVPHLVARLQAEAARPGAVASATHLLLHDRTGQPWNLFTFSHVVAEIREAAAASMAECAGLMFRELRHTAVTRLHEAGVADTAIAGVTGHSSKTVRDMLDKHYLVRTAKAAEGAFRKRLAAEENDP